ncbi:PH domain-containing protein [Abyssalbus ytuae]|uniref:PH domain-containing protein n=1 Tax=Abyssalbus ytuae TaxID=2926907 RepID=A0A9E6ZKA1_9FLAO|nr:PH domain-containing protein [Abyssalbus ytuae]UOB16099.1 PH domain-containing protein [Abyssalbus ytuae]
MKFESKKDIFFTATILGLNTFLIGVIIFWLISDRMEKQEYWGMFLISGVVVLLFWLFFGTGYELSEEGLIYKSGPFNGKISISRIREIVKGKTLWIGFRPATARKGLIIRYDEYNEIYISPKTNDTFIKKILELNSKIKITE